METGNIQLQSSPSSKKGGNLYIVGRKSSISAADVSFSSSTTISILSGKGKNNKSGDFKLATKKAKSSGYISLATSINDKTNGYNIHIGPGLSPGLSRSLRIYNSQAHSSLGISLEAGKSDQSGGGSVIIKSGTGNIKSGALAISSSNGRKTGMVVFSSGDSTVNSGKIEIITGADMAQKKVNSLNLKIGTTNGIQRNAALLVNAGFSTLASGGSINVVSGKGKVSGNTFLKSNEIKIRSTQVSKMSGSIYFETSNALEVSGDIHIKMSKVNVPSVKKSLKVDSEERIYISGGRSGVHFLTHGSPNSGNVEIKSRSSSVSTGSIRFKHTIGSKTSNIEFVGGKATGHGSNIRFSAGAHFKSVSGSGKVGGPMELLSKSATNTGSLVISGGKSIGSSGAIQISKGDENFDGSSSMMIKTGISSGIRGHMIWTGTSFTK
jgi:hypothetical protein